MTKKYTIYSDNPKMNTAKRKSYEKGGMVSASDIEEKDQKYDAYVPVEDLQEAKTGYGGAKTVTSTSFKDATSTDGKTFKDFRSGKGEPFRQKVALKIRDANLNIRTKEEGFNAS